MKLVLTYGGISLVMSCMTATAGSDPSVCRELTPAAMLVEMTTKKMLGDLKETSLTPYGSQRLDEPESSMIKESFQIRERLRKELERYIEVHEDLAYALKKCGRN